MVQAINEGTALSSARAAEHGHAGHAGHAVWESDDELVRALGTLVQRLRRASGDADNGARVFLLSHVARLEPVRMSDLATTACLDQSTVSRHLRHLEEQGLVSRSPDPEDRRATLLSLSDAGRDTLARHVRAKAEVIATATSRWPAEDRADLTRLLSRLADDLEPPA